MKYKLMFILLSLCLISYIIPGDSVIAADSWDITYSLTSNGKSIDYAQTGDEVTVVFSLGRVDSTDWYMPYVYQVEIMYDEEFFEYVPDSVTVLRDGTGIQKLKREPGAHIIQITQMFPEFKGKMQLGSFKLKVKGTSGSGRIYSDPNTSFLYDSDGGGVTPVFNDLEIFIRSKPSCSVRVFDYVPGYRLVEVDGAADGYSFNGLEMPMSEKYGEKRVWITNELENYTLDEAVEKAKYFITESDNPSPYVEDCGYDVNGFIVADGRVDFKDATAVTAVKNVFQAVTEENILLYLAADVNTDYKVDEADVSEVLNAYFPN